MKLQKIVLFGANGQLGWELRRTLASLGHVHAVDRTQAEMTKESALRDLLRSEKPALIVNAAAYTAVDRAESEEELAFAVNARAVRILGEEAARLKAGVVHFSTDYVFDGNAKTPYDESAPTAPLGSYGRTKLAGEQALFESEAAAVVFRTSWVYGARGANFLRTMLRLARERDALRVVADQTGAPTGARFLAEATAQILAQARGGFAGFLRETGGVYHMTAQGETTWHNFACEILENDPRKPEQTCKSVIAISTTDYPTPARRPQYSVLSNEKLFRMFALVLPDWKTQLSLILQDSP